ncbi:unnamed protein product [Choristocarpus tenellus]
MDHLSCVCKVLTTKVSCISEYLSDSYYAPARVKTSIERKRRMTQSNRSLYSSLRMGKFRQKQCNELKACLSVSPTLDWAKLYRVTSFSFCELRGLYELFKTLGEKPMVAPCASTAFETTVCLKNNGSMSQGIQRHQFLAACELGGLLGLSEVVGHFGSRLFTIFDTDGDGILGFKDFVCGLNHLLKGPESEKLKLTFKAYNLNGKGKWVTLEDMTSVLACASEAAYPTLLKFIQEQERAVWGSGSWDRHAGGSLEKGDTVTGELNPENFRAMSRRNAAAYAERTMKEFDQDKDGRLSRKEFKRWARSSPVLRCRLNEFSIDINVVPFQGVRLD